MSKQDGCVVGPPVGRLVLNRRNICGQVRDTGHEWAEGEVRRQQVVDSGVGAQPCGSIHERGFPVTDDRAVAVAHRGRATDAEPFIAQPVLQDSYLTRTHTE